MITFIRPHDINLFTNYILFSVQNNSHSKYLPLVHDSIRVFDYYWRFIYLYPPIYKSTLYYILLNIVSKYELQED